MTTQKRLHMHPTVAIAQCCHLVDSLEKYMEKHRSRTAVPAKKETLHTKMHNLQFLSSALLPSCG